MKNKENLTIDCIADLHGYYPHLEGGDLLIVAGDLTSRDTSFENSDFLTWLIDQPYRKKIYISGNHDNLHIESKPKIHYHICKDGKNGIELFEYLCDSGTEFEGLKIWGTPWTKTFKGMNPKCKAFTCDTEEELADKFSLIPDDIDILITHGPPASLLDKNYKGYNCGSPSLMVKFQNMKNRPKLFCFGHIHESYGEDEYGDTKIVNCSHVNEHYEPVNKPIRIIL